MSVTASQPETDYFLRKLHSLTGTIPVGAFLAEHFWSNSYALVSVSRYDAKSQELQTIPFRVAVEWLFIFFCRCSITVGMAFTSGCAVNRTCLRIRG
jgi:succinate dehydrogenase / fumarate reductase cytochrome b subunit